MNYYIHGNAANADKIKAAFEELGYNTGNLGFTSSQLYYTIEGKVELMCNKALQNLVKTHPDYDELELPVEPNFKVGDWIVQNDNGTVSQITKIINGKDEYGEYRAYEHTNGYFHTCFENEYHLWTIADAKDGDVLATNNIICIFRKLDKDGYYIISPCVYTVKGGLEIISDENDTIGSCGFKPTTKEDRDILFRKMKGAGYEWDADKKELRKIKPHYDITNFHAGMPVLVRADNNCKWDYSVFSRITGNEDWQFAVCNGVSFTQCIPFEWNEHLLGTTNPCDERFINW